jgi:psiF repeat.
MMKKLIATLGLALGLMALPVLSQAQGTPQQSRMAQCNKEATGKTGEARKTFMKECLASKPAPQPKQPSLLAKKPPSLNARQNKSRCRRKEADPSAREDVVLQQRCQGQRHEGRRA